MSDSNSRDNHHNNNNNIKAYSNGDDSQKKQQHQQDEQVLLTKKSLALALSAPRAPPIGSAHRSLLLGQDPSYTPSWKQRHYRVRDWHHDVYNHAHEILEHEQAVTTALLQERLRQRLHRSHHHHHSYHPNDYQYSSFHRRHRLPHPHLPAGPELGDQMTRFLGRILPLSWQHKARDSGMARRLVDAIVTTSAPLLALQKPSAVFDFIQLSSRVKRISYGSHERQYMELLEPNEHYERKNSSNNSSTADNATDAECCTRRLIFFVHGGAWGSGQAWMYRLVAKPFLQQGYAAAILSYRVYPTDTDNNVVGPIPNSRNKSSSPSCSAATAAAAAASILNQVEDCHLAAQHLQRYYPHYSHNVTVMGHSSGAHVSLYWLVERAKRQMKKAITSRSTSHNSRHNTCPEVQQQKEEEDVPPPLTIDSYIGIAGPYDISHHFDYEAARGVEEFSPMKPVCGYTRRNFRIHSPALNLLDSLATFDTTTKFDTTKSSGSSSSSSSNSSNKTVVVEHYFPHILLVHGVEDETVPFTATAEAARVLRSCGVLNVQELYNESVQHQEAVMQLMLGGIVLDEILDWIQRLPTTPPCNSSSMHNRLHGDDSCYGTLSSSSSTATTTRAPPIIRSKL